MAHHPKIYVCATYHLSIVLRELGLFKVCDVWRVWRVWRAWRVWRVWLDAWTCLDAVRTWYGHFGRLAASGRRLADVWQTSGRRLEYVWPRLANVW